jgi:hypothetical protein
VLALVTLQSWVNWPLNPREILIGPEVCRPLSGGALQTANAALQADAWQRLFLLAVVIAALVALLCVLFTYLRGRSVGLPFVRRWFWMILASAFLAGVATAVALFAIPLQTTGCESGEVMANLPTEWLVFRSVLAFAHGAVFFILLSWALSFLLGRTLKRRRWYDNHRVPFPYLLPRRHG